jgi:hypothetical protein
MNLYRTGVNQIVLNENALKGTVLNSIRAYAQARLFYTTYSVSHGYEVHPTSALCPPAEAASRLLPGSLKTISYVPHLKENCYICCALK